VQAVLELHDTPDKKLYIAPVGLGIDWTDQLVPFQASANARSVPAPLLVKPTAMQDVPVVHEVPNRPPVGTTGLGVDCTVQGLCASAGPVPIMARNAIAIPAVKRSLANGRIPTPSYLAS
jgi:hypothetical protein